MECCTGLVASGVNLEAAALALPLRAAAAAQPQRDMPRPDDMQFGDFCGHMKGELLHRAGGVGGGFSGGVGAGGGGHTGSGASAAFGGGGSRGGNANPAAYARSGDDNRRRDWNNGWGNNGWGK